MLDLSQNLLIPLAIAVAVMPLFALVVSAVAWLRPSRHQPRVADAVLSVRRLGWMTRVFAIVEALASILIALAPPDRFPLRFAPLGFRLYLDALSVYFLLLVNLVAFFASWYTVGYLETEISQHGDAWVEKHRPESFHFFFNAFHWTMLLVPMVDNLIWLWMMIELTTLTSTLLVRFRGLRAPLEAAWKYIMITTAGIVFSLFGTILLLNAITPTTCAGQPVTGAPAVDACTKLDALNVDIMSWSWLARSDVARNLDAKWVILSFFFVLVGYGTKAGLAPMHTWLPDGHGEAPSPVSAFLSGVLLKSALYAILRFATITNLSLGTPAFTSSMLLIAGLASLVIATPFVVKRNKFKRVLAYHSLEHMGIIAFGLGIGGDIALLGALLHALNHALTKAFMFLTFETVRSRHVTSGVLPKLADEEPDEREIRGVLQSMPATGVVLLLGGLALVGAPPFNIFLSELLILWGALRQVIPGAAAASMNADAAAAGVGPLPGWTYALATAVFLVTVTIIFGGLVRHLSTLLLGRPPSRKAGPGAPAARRLQDDWGELVPLLLLLGIILFFGLGVPIWPINFRQLLEQSVQILHTGAP